MSAVKMKEQLVLRMMGGRRDGLEVTTLRLEERSKAQTMSRPVLRASASNQLHPRKQN